MTVRELARSQGFPDHFVFYAIGDRVVTVCGLEFIESSPTKSLLQMHRQIGNAVSWPVSVAIAREFRSVLFKKWIEDHKDNDAMEIDRNRT